MNERVNPQRVGMFQTYCPELTVAAGTRPEGEIQRWTGSNMNRTR